MPRFDLHSHSTASDGLLTPSELIARAVARGVDVLALTDHDDTGGLAEARGCGKRHRTDARPRRGAFGDLGERHAFTSSDCRSIPATASSRRGSRRSAQVATRARQRIAQSLAEAGIANAYEGARKYVTSDRLVSRSHFARFLVEQGHAKDMQQVFKRFLVRRQAGLCRARVGDAGARRWGGFTPRAARPCSRTRGAIASRRPACVACSASFATSAATGIEVLSSSHTLDQFGEYAGYARVFGLLASVGSDYHGPGESSVDLGAMPALPAGTTPVWSTW